MMFRLKCGPDNAPFPVAAAASEARSSSASSVAHAGSDDDTSATDSRIEMKAAFVMVPPRQHATASGRPAREHRTAAVRAVSGESRHRRERRYSPRSRELVVDITK